jgi:hypothetical protein
MPSLYRLSKKEGKSRETAIRRWPKVVSLSSSAALQLVIQGATSSYYILKPAPYSTGMALPNSRLFALRIARSRRLLHINHHTRVHLRLPIRRALSTSHPHPQEQQPSKSTSITPRQKYEELLTHSTLRVDAHQQRIVDKLQRLWLNLQDYDPPRVPEPIIPSRVSSVSLSRVDLSSELIVIRALISGAHQSPLSRCPLSPPHLQRGYTSTAMLERENQC